MSERSRLLWRCRRGIREMDMLCLQFMEQCFDTLSDEEKNIFEKLLDESDLDILNWILGKSAPKNTEYNTLIALFKNLNPVD